MGDFHLQPPEQLPGIGDNQTYRNMTTINEFGRPIGKINVTCEKLLSDDSIFALGRRPCREGFWMQMKTATRSAVGLPSFKNPPLDEVAIALQFDSLSPFTSVYGEYGRALGDKVLRTEEHDPIIPSFETFSASPALAEFRFQLVNEVMLPRVWFVEPDERQLTQVQANRFIFNWRRFNGEGVYPRFETVFREFSDRFTTYEKVVADTLRKELVISQCDLTYFNVFELGSDETGAEAFERVFTTKALERAGNHYAGLSVEPELSLMTHKFVLRDEKSGEPIARLHSTVEPGVKQSTGERVLRLSLLFRGPPPSQDRQEIFGFLKRGRETIVRTFTDLTSVECHEAWGREA